MSCTHDFKVRRATGGGSLITQTLCRDCGCSPSYAQYMEKVGMAQRAGYANKDIADELLREKATIMPRCMVKQAMLSGDRTPYKRRQAASSAHECIVAIDRIVKELLEPKETIA